MEGTLLDKKSGVILLILDGWGLSPSFEGNAIANAKTPNFDFYFKNYPHTSLAAAGEEVGLTWGEVGNSEVGHLNIGGGRVVWQYLARINHAILDNTFFKNQILISQINSTSKQKKNLHLIGLASSGGVHSHIDHLLALLKIVKRHGSPTTYLHLFTDGRDTHPQAAIEDISKIQKYLNQIKIGKIATICGRYFAMDRDRRWDRTELAYNAITAGIGNVEPDAITAIKKSYKAKIFDEFIKPTVIRNKTDKPDRIMYDGDSAIFFNFREDRMVQLVKSFWEADFSEFNRKVYFPNLAITTFTKYRKDFPFSVAFPYQGITNSLAEILSSQKIPQLHIAETEKYAHITYFFNGGQEKAFPLEDRILIPSPKVKTYDKKPEMSAFEISKNACEKIHQKNYRFIVINIANPDMVGHTGDFNASIKAVETTDKVIDEITKCAFDNQYLLLMTSDHGNVEESKYQITGRQSKDHTTNPVPFILLDPQLKFQEKDALTQNQNEDLSPVGVLADVAPTVLELLGVNKPKEMTGYSLLPILLK